MLPIGAPDGKLTPDLIAEEAWGWGDEHRAQPLVVYITQSSELGTVYTPDEVRAITDYAHERGMRVFMDGARLSNAAAALDLPLRAFTTDVGVDVVSFGGTKNGALGAEAIVVLDAEASDGLIYLRKHSDAARVEDAVRLCTAARAARRRPLSAQRPARERDGGAAALAACRPASPTAPYAASSSPSRHSRTPCSLTCRRASPTGCASASVSTTGKRPAARCAGYAASTRSRRTSTRSSRRRLG